MIWFPHILLYQLFVVNPLSTIFLNPSAKIFPQQNQDPQVMISPIVVKFITDSLVYIASADCRSLTISILH